MDPDYYRQMAALQQNHWWYRGRRAILKSFIRHYVHKAAAMDILEAGCGPGANLEMLASFGNVKAFEPEDWAAAHAAKISGAEVKTGGLPVPLPFDQDFDLVCAFDVIEHIEDDKAALAALFARTKPGGFAVFTVPAHQWLWSGHDEINHHKRRYAYGEFRDLLSGAGYTIEKLSYYNAALFPLAVLVRAIKNIFKLKEESDVSMPPAIVNWILFHIFAAEAYALHFMRLPFGLSLIAMARKDS